MPLPYATPANVKNRLNITDTSQDPLLYRLCDEINQYIETVTHRAIGSSSVAGELLDGFEAREGRFCLEYPRGIRSITTLGIALYTGASYTSAPAADFYLRPHESRRTPGWPATEIWLTDIPSGSGPSTFETGWANVWLTADIGWAQMPPDLRGTAEVAVSRAYHAREAGYGDDVGVDEIGEVTVSRFLSSHDYRILRRYAWKPVEII